MLDHLFWVAVGVAGAAGAAFAYLVAKKGGAWASAKLSSWWSATETRFKAIEADVAALKTKVGL